MECNRDDFKKIQSENDSFINDAYNKIREAGLTAWQAVIVSDLMEEQPAAAALPAMLDFMAEQQKEIEELKKKVEESK